MKWLTKQRKPNRERDIFEFWDGSQQRHVDPLPVWYKLWEQEDIDTVLKRAGANELEAVTELVGIARDIFSIAPFDATTGAGLTDMETMELLMKYLDFTGELKKKHGPLPIPGQKSAPQPSSETSTTPPDAESSSNPPESPNVEPSTVSTPSPTP